MRGMPPAPPAPTDPVAIAQALIRCRSVTPADAGALAIVEAVLSSLGFSCQRLKFDDVENLYARLGTAGPNFCFAGHSDVVPPGDPGLWRFDPFAGEVANGVLHGRGAADMKGGIAAFIAAVARGLAAGWTPKGSIGLIITGDEEGAAVNGTAKVLEWMKAHGEAIDHCLVGEPTSVVKTGDTIKIGRRGSMTARVSVKGTQGHVAYPKRAVNPIPILAELVSRLSALTLDDGTAHFEASTLVFTTIDVGNPANNVIPAEARATLNIRFNDRHTPEGLQRLLEEIAASVGRDMGGMIGLDYQLSGVAFLTEPGPFTALLSDAVAEVTGRRPEFSTTGGTSDARFIRNYCPVAELGLVGVTMHKADECVTLDDLETLTRIYEAALKRYFA
jgi:succinyl-diaminopimelate desuccinylase